MANANLTMLDVAKINGSDKDVGLIEENLNAAPEAIVLPARTISGTGFKSLVRTAYPVTGFRSPGGVTQTTKSTYINRYFETFYYDGQMEVDNAVATADEQGIDHALSIEADGHGRAFLLRTGSSVWYGQNTTIAGTGDALGFPGALAICDSSLVVDAGGTTDNVASSVYAIVAMPKFMELLFGRNMVMSSGDWRKQSVTRTVGGTTGEVTAWKNSLEGYIGAAYYSKYAVGRIKKLTTDANKGLTDALLSQLLALFPVGIKPTHFFMTRRSRQQLQASRTVVLQGNGKIRPDQATVAPVPTEYDGVPIHATDSLLNIETLAL